MASKRKEKKPTTMKGAAHDGRSGHAVTYEPYNAIPERIAARRHRLGLTQAQVVDRVRAIANRADGWPRDSSWLGKIESGTNKLDGLDDAMILGHASVVTTSNLYTHVETEEIARKMRGVGW